jgi:ribosomal protein L40E
MAVLPKRKAKQGWSNAKKTLVFVAVFFGTIIGLSIYYNQEVTLFWSCFGFSYLIMCVLPAMVAEQKGYDYWTYYIVGVLIDPIITLVVAILMPRTSRVRLIPVMAAPSAKEKDITRQACPECGELISVDARSCRYCHIILPEKQEPEKKPATVKRNVIMRMPPKNFGKRK